MVEPVPLSFNRDFAPETGSPVPIAPGVVRVTAPNGGPYTFTGTNSFLLGEEALCVVDPGPDDPGHLAALLSAIGDRKLVAIILTHTHQDHCALAPRLAKATGAPLWFAGPHRPPRAADWLDAYLPGRKPIHRLRPDRRLLDNEVLELGPLRLEIIATPGHCANHLALGIKGTPYLLTGDHIMGWNSTLVAFPDGSLADYFASLDKVLASPYTHYVPAHGGAIPDGPAYARALKAHRLMRNKQIVEAVESGATTPGMVLNRVYPDLTGKLRLAARMMMSAHLRYLIEHGEIGARRSGFGRKLYRKPA